MYSTTYEDGLDDETMEDPEAMDDDADDADDADDYLGMSPDWEDGA